jgi:RNA polymerase sigma-70 factor (ECF subfamily)
MTPTPHAIWDSLFGISDEQAMWRVATEDDEAAFAMLMRRWEAPIQRLCAHMIGDSHHAEDLAQETFAHAFVSRKNYQSRGKVSTWLWRIALNLCYDELRRRKRRPETSLDDNGADTVPLVETLAGAEIGPDDSLAEKESGEMVRRALLGLPEPQRAVLVLRHYQDLKFREIAAVLEIPEGTVKSRMAEALTAMGRMLKRTLPSPPATSPGADNKSKERLLI